MTLGQGNQVTVEVAARWLFRNEYSKSSYSQHDFWISLSQPHKRLVQDFLGELKGADKRRGKRANRSNASVSDALLSASGQPGDAGESGETK